MEEIKIHKPFIVGVDVDNTINNYTKVALEYYNKKYNDNIQYDKILKYDLQSYLTPECKNIYQEFESSDEYANVGIASDCKTALGILNERYSIMFITAAPVASLAPRRRWLKEQLGWDKEPFLIRSIDRPSLNMLDVLIDDCLDNLHGAYDGIIYAQPWNLIRDVDLYGDMLRSDNWSAILAECKWSYKDKYFLD